MKRKIFPSIILCIIIAVFFAASCGLTDPGSAELNGQLRIENGAAQPMLRWNDLRANNYSNQGSDILRYCVYVETDNDTDNDGMADLVKVLMQVPRSAAEGNYKAATIYDPTPYAACSNSIYVSSPEELYEEEEFDFDLLYQDCQKRSAAGSMTTLELSERADPADWNYKIPNMEDQSYYNANDLDYYLIRGFAVACASGIGTYGSEGFELCGMDLERDSHKCVVEWLAGQRTAYTDKTSNIAIEADWSNGNVAMAGCSYGGTIPFEVATTGVSGLKTIIPSAGIANWYDYTNSQGAPLRYDVHYTDSLAAGNCGGCFTDPDLTVLKPGYGSYLWTVSQAEEETNGDYAPIWDIKNYAKRYEGINCSALIVQGVNDYNVMTKQADLMMQAFAKAGQPAKLVLHQEAHLTLDGRSVNGEIWEETVNKWLCHYLYGTENGIENMAAVTVQSNVDGSWKTYDSWRDFSYQEVPAEPEDKGMTSKVNSATIAEAATNSFNAEGETGVEVTQRELYYSGLQGDQAAKYRLALPEEAVIYGVPEIHTKLAAEDINKDGMMITAVLVDTADDGSEFQAFASTPFLGGETIPTDVKAESYTVGGGHEDFYRQEAVQIPTTAKIVSIGWTEIRNPGCGPDASDYEWHEEELFSGVYYDYTFYLQPTVYTVAPGHHLELILTTWDPYRAFLDEEYEIDSERDPRYSFYTYGYTVDNSALRVLLPLKQES